MPHAVCFDTSVIGLPMQPENARRMSTSALPQLEGTRLAEHTEDSVPDIVDTDFMSSFSHCTTASSCVGVLIYCCSSKICTVLCARHSSALPGPDLR